MSYVMFLYGHPHILDIVSVGSMVKWGELWMHFWERWVKSVIGCQCGAFDDFILIHTGHFSIS